MSETSGFNWRGAVWCEDAKHASESRYARLYLGFRLSENGNDSISYSYKLYVK